MSALDFTRRNFDKQRMTPPRKGKLPRLEKHHYQGHAAVFWTNTLEERARGWLTPGFHTTFRELMLHAAAREQLVCPAYCLMPDHLHLLWMGLRRESDQLNAMKFLRTHLEPAGRRSRMATSTARSCLARGGTAAEYVCELLFLHHRQSRAGKTREARHRLAVHGRDHPWLSDVASAPGELLGALLETLRRGPRG